MRRSIGLGLYLALAPVVWGDSLAGSGICSKLSVGDVQAALGGKLEKPVPLPAQPTSPGGCSYSAGLAFLTVMLFEPDAPADFYQSLGTASANQFKPEPVSGLGSKAAHMPSNFFVLAGKRVLTVNYYGAPRAKIEPLVRQLVPKL